MYTAAEVAITRINWVDILAIILAVRMGYVGYKTGFGQELVRLFGLISGFFISFKFYQTLGDRLASWTFLNVEWASALVMIVLAVGVYWLLTRVLLLLERIVLVTFDHQVASVGGLVAGMIRGALIASVILVVCRQLPSDYLDASIESRSISGPQVSRMAPAVYDTIVGLPKNLLARLE